MKRMICMLSLFALVSACDSKTEEPAAPAEPAVETAPVKAEEPAEPEIPAEMKSAAAAEITAENADAIAAELEKEIEADQP